MSASGPDCVKTPKNDSECISHYVSKNENSINSITYIIEFFIKLANISQKQKFFEFSHSLGR